MPQKFLLSHSDVNLTFLQKENGNRYQLKRNQNINLRIAKAALKAWDSCQKAYFQKEGKRDKTVQR